MEADKQTVLTELIRMCYDQLVKEGRRSDDSKAFYRDFLREITRSELKRLRDEYAFEVPKVAHPVLAIRKYIAMMVQASVFRSLNEVRILGVDGSCVNLQQFRCAYRYNCGRHPVPLCIRGYALGLAVETMCPARLLGVSTEFQRGGNCRITLDIGFDGDLADVPDPGPPDPLYRILDGKESLELSIAMWVEGIETAALKVLGPDEGRRFLQRFYRDLVQNWIETFFKMDTYVGLPISLWEAGQPVFGREPRLEDRAGDPPM